MHRSIGLISVSKGDLPPLLAKEVWLSKSSLELVWVSFDADPNGTSRCTSRFPTACRECQGCVRRMTQRRCLVFNV